MADEIAPSATAPASAPAAPQPAVSAPAEAAPSTPTPAVVAEVKPAETTALGGEPVKPPETKPAEEAPPADAKPGETKSVAEAKPAEGDVKKDEGSLSAEPAPLPAYEPFKLPEGATLDAERLGKFTTLLGEFERTTKTSHEDVAKFGQSLVDQYVAEVQETTKRLNEYYTNAFEKQKSEWRDAFTKDPEIGGNRQETTVKQAVANVGKFGGTPEQQTELRTFFNNTGTGNYPGLIRLITNMANRIDQLTQESGKMLPGVKPAMGSRSKVETRYGKTA